MSKHTETSKYKNMKKIITSILFLISIQGYSQFNASQIKKDGITIIGNALNQLSVDTTKVASAYANSLKLNISDTAAMLVNYLIYGDTASMLTNYILASEVTTYTDEMAQDAVGGMVNSSLTYTDGTPLLSIASADFGNITTSTNGTVWTIDVGSVLNTMLANSTISGIALGSSLADLTATNSTLTFSGTYNGSAARTIGLNLGAANTWSADQSVPDEAYDATGWNGSFEVPTKNAVRDKIETMSAGGLTIGTTTITSGTDKQLLFNNAGVLGEITRNTTATNKFLRQVSSGTATFEEVADADLSTSDITTNNVTTAKHGFLPKAPNDSMQFYRGNAAWDRPQGLVVLIASNETDTSGTTTSLLSRPLTTPDLTPYSQIILETEVGLSGVANATNEVSFAIEGNLGTTTFQTINLKQDATGAGDLWKLAASLKWSGASNVAPYSIQVTVVAGLGTWTIYGFRIYGVY
jgi:hypothetical protein